MRGIGPCYSDKVGRSHAVRLGDLYRDDFARRGSSTSCAAKNRCWPARRRRAPTSGSMPAEIVAGNTANAPAAETVRGRHDRLSARCGRSRPADALRRGAGALLDIDHGTFPFVTSSNSSGRGRVERIRRSGPIHQQGDRGDQGLFAPGSAAGRFPPSRTTTPGQHIRDRGNEYGTVTRRPRRCGWFDAVAARYTARLSGVDSLAVMLLDVLSDLPELKICTAYELDGRARAISPATWRTCGG